MDPQGSYYESDVYTVPGLAAQMTGFGSDSADDRVRAW
jgi:hypothetical protein